MEFIEKYAKLDGSDDEDEEMAKDDEVRHQSDDDFIDNDDFQDQNPSDYRIKNITRDLQEAMQDKELWKEFECSDPENYVPPYYDEGDYQYDEFQGYEKGIEKLKESLKICREGDKESFYFAFFYCTCFKLKREEIFTEEIENLQEVLGQKFFNLYSQKG